MCLHVGSQQLIQMSNGASSENSKNCIFIFTFLFFIFTFFSCEDSSEKLDFRFLSPRSKVSFSVCSLREIHMFLLCWDWLLMILTKHWVSVMWAHHFFPLSVFSLKGKLVFLTIWHSAGGFQSERDWFDISTSEAFQRLDLRELPQSVIVILWKIKIKEDCFLVRKSKIAKSKNKWGDCISVVIYSFQQQLENAFKKLNKQIKQKKHKLLTVKLQGVALAYYTHTFYRV